MHRGKRISSNKTILDSFFLRNLLSEVFWLRFLFGPAPEDFFFGVSLAPGFKNPHSTKLVVVRRRFMFLRSLGRLTMLSAFSFAIPLRTVRVGAAASIKYL